MGYGSNRKCGLWERRVGKKKGWGVIRVTWGGSPVTNAYARRIAATRAVAPAEGSWLSRAFAVKHSRKVKEVASHE